MFAVAIDLQNIFHGSYTICKKEFQTFDQNKKKIKTNPWASISTFLNSKTCDRR